MTFYIYHVPGVKIGATCHLNARIKHNINKYGIEPYIIETLIGPDEESTWQTVGDLEWNWADHFGYDRGTHYKQSKIGGCTTGKKNVESGHLNRVRPSKNVAIECGKKVGKFAVESGHLKRLTENRKITITIDGVTYESITVARNKTGLSYNKIKHIQKFGKLPNKLDKRKISVIINGIIYESFNDAHRKTGLSYTTLSKLKKESS